MCLLSSPRALGPSNVRACVAARPVTFATRRAAADSLLVPADRPQRAGRRGGGRRKRLADLRLVAAGRTVSVVVGRRRAGLIDNEARPRAVGAALGVLLQRGVVAVAVRAPLGAVRDVPLGVVRQVGSLALAIVRRGALQAPVGDLVDARLPGALRVTEPECQRDQHRTSVRLEVTSEDHAPLPVRARQIGLHATCESGPLGVPPARRAAARRWGCPLVPGGRAPVRQPPHRPASRGGDPSANASSSKRTWNRGMSGTAIPPRQKRGGPSAPQTPRSSSAACRAACESPRSRYRVQAAACRARGAPRRFSRPRGPAR
jgi:hypothetical protein